DTEFASDPDYTPPQHGQLDVFPDGAFTYTPDPGFQGTDRFTYRSVAFVDGLGCQPGSRGVLDQRVASEPVEVVLLIGAAQMGCPADLSGDGVVSAQALATLLSNWGACASAPAACPGDLNGDGGVSAVDLAGL